MLLAPLAALHAAEPTTTQQIDQNSITPLVTADYPVQPVPFTAVKIIGGFWQPRQEINRAVTLPYAFQQSTKRIKNFDLATEVMKRRAAGETSFKHNPPTDYPFDDSDLFKAIEGASFAMSVKPDPALDQRLDGYIARIAAAQEPDGYLYTWRTMHPDSPAHDWIGKKRWEKEPELSHELYNLGHLYEAGTAHFQATGKRTLLDICLKSAELLQKDFGSHELKIAPGHQVIEMGLAKLYRITGDKRWIDLAKYFLDVRGPGQSDYNQRHQKVVDPAEARYSHLWASGDYNQRHQKVVDQRTAVGHAVRANYMYSGMVDVAALTGDQSYLTAITAIWENAVGRKMHLTGGVGARARTESYGNDYELPHNCYNETCAAIAFMMWNHRMFLMTGDGKYMDVFERTLHNGFLSGVSLSGDRFFYPNPLEYDGKAKNNHGKAGRAAWFGCACCPPNVLRTMAALTEYFCAVRDDRLYVNLYAQSEAEATVQGVKVAITQTTEYPWNGAVRLMVNPAQAATFTLALRIPGWVQGRPVPSDLYTYDDATPAAWSVSVDSIKVDVKPESGYVLLKREWKPGSVVTLDLPMPVRRVNGNPAIVATRNQVALERGPVVYCLEGVDHPDLSLFETWLPDDARIEAVPRPDLLEGVTVLTITAQRAERATDGATTGTPVTLTAIPYFAWNNRGLSPMRTWFPRNAEGLRPRPLPTIAAQSKVSVSFTRGGEMDPQRLNDQLLPLNATDGFATAFDFWPHKGTAEWMQYDFKQPEKVSEVSIMWFDDTGRGQCRVPASWSLSYKAADGSWKPVEGASGYPSSRDALHRVTFTPVTTSALRIEIQLQQGWSTGAFEWMVK
ncbi:MAG: glycoside hydrolase family 127 protein [Verrucomicrobia bacterium]|nr:glycoside hydrolase family 127 protein [Verrucomicrobiota bacterium]